MALSRAILTEIQAGKKNFKPSAETPDAIIAFQPIARRVNAAEQQGLVRGVKIRISHFPATHGNVLAVLVVGGLTFAGEQLLKARAHRTTNAETTAKTVPLVDGAACSRAPPGPRVRPRMGDKVSSIRVQRNARRQKTGVRYTAPVSVYTSHAMQFTAVFEQVPEGFVAFVEELPGANAQGDTLEEARENLTEAVALVLEANRTLAEEGLRGKDVIREPLVVQ